MKGAVLAVGLAALVFASASAGEEASRFIGDANCDRSVNSVDAALLLQYGAGLVDSLPCQANADVSWDGAINSLDASLVLQKTANRIFGFIRMSLAVTRPDGLCDNEVRPTTCNVPAGTEFGLSILLDNAPPEGYVGLQTQLYYSRLRYNATFLPEEEIVWPDAAFTLRATLDDDVGKRQRRVAHASGTGLIPPFRASAYAGQLVTLSFSCALEGGDYLLALSAYRPGEHALGAGLLLDPQATDGIRRIVPAQTAEQRDLDLDLSGTIEPHERDLPLSAVLMLNCV